MAIRNWLTGIWQQCTQARRLPARRRVRLCFRAEALENRALLASFIAAGTDAGVPAEVRIFADEDQNGRFETETTGLEGYTFSPYSDFQGGVRVALGDFDGDGNDELATAAGPGGGPHVLIYDLSAGGLPQAPLDSFFAYAPIMSAGVYLTAGDLDGDGRDELITAADQGGGPHVRIFSDTDGDGRLSDNEFDSFFAYSGSFAGGVRLAAGDVDGDGDDELITAQGPGGTLVKVWDDADQDRAVSDDPLLDEFVAYGGFGGGAYVAAGAIAGAGGPGAEIVTAAGAGGGPHVKIFTDTDADGQVSDDPLFDQFFAYVPGFTGGVRVAASDTNGDALAEVITTPGPGGGPHLKIFGDNGDSGSLLSDNPVNHEFFAFSPGFAGGVFVAGGNVTSATFSYGGEPLTIPEDGPGGDMAQAVIHVPSGAGLIRDLDVSVFIPFENNTQLVVSLIHVPSSTSVDLMVSDNGIFDGYLVRLDDEAPTDIADATPVTGDSDGDELIRGRFNPTGTSVLSAFDGLNASGHWLLAVDDTAGAGTPPDGELFGFTLHLTV